MADTTLTTGGAQTLTQAGSTYGLPDGETISGTMGTTGGNASGNLSTAGNGTDGGVALTGIDYVLANYGHVVGGTGGNGGIASGIFSRSGNGGTGGAGVSGTDFNLTNTGTVSGGLGGSAGGSGWGYGGDGGNGGAAVSGAGFTLINSGIITGGNGLGGGNASFEGGKGGNGGAGVVATGNATIYNAGTINGGTPGNEGPGQINAGAGTAGSAIELSGGGNTLVLQDNSVITGNLVSTSGSINGGDALILEGTQSNALDATGIQGFASYTKRGIGTWSLTGAPAPIVTMTTVMVPMDPMDCSMFGPPCPDTPTQVPVYLPNVTSWNIEAGTLSIGSDSNLGDVSGGLTLSGGTLLTTADVSSTRDITLTQNTVSSIDNGGHNDIFAGEISGGGGLTFAGSGKTTLTGGNTYAGTTSISNGTLFGGATDTFSASSATTVNAAGVLDLGGFAQTINSVALLGDNTNPGGTIQNGSLTGAITSTGGNVNSIGGSASLTVAVGNTSLTGANTYTGTTTVNNGVLMAYGVNAFSAASATTVNAGGTLNLNQDAQTINNVTLAGGTITSGALTGAISSTGGTLDNIGGSANLTTTAGTTLLGANSSLGAVTVGGGTLRMNQTGVLTAASYTTANGATTAMGAASQLNVTGIFTQAAGSTLNVAIGANDPAITAATAALDGTLNVSGYAGTQFTVLHTTGGITGDFFGGLNIGGASASSVDYLKVSGSKTANGNDYVVDLGLSWNATPADAHGTFTLASASETFTVSEGLGNRSGIIGGWGGESLHKAGAGTLILSADNTYTGDTTISAGRLQLGDGGTSGSILGNVLNDGTLVFNRSDALTFAGVISGSGAVEQIGSGTTLMTGANSYTGVTSISGGTLAIGASASVISNVVNHAAFENAGTVGGSVSNGAGATFTQTGGSVAGGLSNNGTVNANGGTLDGAIANNTDGRFTVGGVVTSNGVFDNTQDAILEVLNAGDYRLGGLLTNAGDVTISAGGTLTAGGIRNTASGSITNDGTVNDDLDNAGLYTNNAIQNARVASNTGTLVNSQGATWTGDFATAGIVNNDGTINGSLTQSAGTTTNNGRISGAVLINGGLYSGSGSTGALTVGNGATFQPGSGTAGSSATVNGELVFQSGSTYRVNLDTSGASLTTATGLATLNGGTVDVQAGSGNYAPATGYTILSANGVTGRFADVSSNLAFLTPSLSYAANSVTLQMTRNDTGFATVSDTRNQRAAAGALDRLGMGNPVYDAVVQLDAAGARQAFDQLGGEAHASAQTALIEDGRFVREAALDRLRPGACGISGATTTLGANDRESTVDTGCDADQSVTWMRAFGSWGSVASDGNAAGLDHSTGGVLLGADREMENGARIGVLGGFSHTNIDVNDRHTSGKSENYHLGVYAGKQWGALALRSGVAYTWHDLSSRRSVEFGGFSDSLRSDDHAETAQVFGELGYALEAGVVTLEPFVNLAYVGLHTGGFTERGGAAALSAKGGNSDTTFSTLGLHGSTGLDLGGVRTNATGSLGWRHAFGDTTPTSSLSFASGSSSFFTAGVPIAKDVAVVDLGLDFSVGKNTTLGVSYSGQFGSGVTDNGVRGNFKLEF
ncbi:autotransporter domain-containing protein [Pseudomonas sediminis]|uniref:autotransporter domain-containing protein n=1 Tax=Pseudomonas sediminis TaxID=1691904 RepID=UPI0031CC79F0